MMAKLSVRRRSRRSSIEEKRHSSRRPCSIEVRATLLPSLTSGGSPRLYLRGVAQDIGEGGLRVLGDELLPPNSVARCEVVVTTTGMAIPTVTLVRWSRPTGITKRYLIGLEFLL
jgi:PilZ domain